MRGYRQVWQQLSDRMPWQSLRSASVLSSVLEQR